MTTAQALAHLESRITHDIHQVGPVPQGQADEAGTQLNNIKTQGLRLGMEGGEALCLGGLGLVFQAELAAQTQWPLWYRTWCGVDWQPDSLPVTTLH